MPKARKTHGSGAEIGVPWATHGSLGRPHIFDHFEDVKEPDWWSRLYVFRGGDRYTRGWYDHIGRTKIGRESVLVAEPYQFGLDEMRLLNRLHEDFGCTATIHGTSRHNFGVCLTVLVYPGPGMEGEIRAISGDDKFEEYILWMFDEAYLSITGRKAGDGGGAGYIHDVVSKTIFTGDAVLDVALFASELRRQYPDLVED